MFNRREFRAYVWSAYGHVYQLQQKQIAGKELTDIEKHYLEEWNNRINKNNENLYHGICFDS